MERKNYLTPQQVADILGLKQATARLLIKSQMPYIRIGNGRVLVEEQDFTRWIESRERNSNARGMK